MPVHLTEVTGAHSGRTTESLRRHRRRRLVMSVAFLLGLSAIYFLARLPWLSEPLRDEEGIFAALVVDRPAARNHGLVARIDAQEHYEPLGHPALLYETLKLAAAPWPPVRPEAAADDARATPRLRLFFCLFQFIRWIILGAVRTTGCGGDATDRQPIRGR